MAEATEKALRFLPSNSKSGLRELEPSNPSRPERTKMMQFWADKIDALRGGGSVVKLAADHRRG